MLNLKELYARKKVGDTVWWLHGGNRAPVPMTAIVVRVNDYSLDLSFVVPKSAVFDGMSGVRHVDDPSLKEGEKANRGAWVETDRDLAYQELLKKVAHLEEDLIADLKSRLAALEKKKQ